MANILEERRMNRKGGQNIRLARLLGILDKDNVIRVNIPEKDRSMYAQTKWQFMLYAPFEISQKCCGVMKKSPAHTYSRKTGRLPITGSMASESKLRTQQWLKNGCNAFENKSPVSNPMSFWTEQDVLLYIYQNDIPIASVYGDVIIENNPDTDLEFADLGIFDSGRPVLRTTGCDRTGCVFCGFGCHLEKESRFLRLKGTHRKLYEYLFKDLEDGGLGYKKIIDWLNENGNLNIRY